VVRKPLILLAIAIVASFAIAACGSDDSSDSSSSTTAASTTESTTASGGGGASGPVDISETEFALDPSDPTVAAGEVTLTATNDGSIQHNLEIEGNGVEEVTDTLDPGDSGDLKVNLKPGTYEIYCSIDSHRDQGMEGTVTVN